MGYNGFHGDWIAIKIKKLKIKSRAHFERQKIEAVFFSPMKKCGFFSSVQKVKFQNQNPDRKTDRTSKQALGSRVYFGPKTKERRRYMPDS